jgi:hypothetical protein
LPKKFIEQWLILCEGTGDVSFFDHLCKVKAIRGFQVESTDGKDNLENYLNGLDVRRGRTMHAPLETIIVAFDNDDTPDDSFKNVRKQLKGAGLPLPNNPFELAEKVGGLSVVVVMIPFADDYSSRKGSLETLLMPSATEKMVDVVQCVDELCRCIDMNSWNSTAQDKLRLRCMISSSFEEDPNISLARALKPEHDLIPLGHQCFNKIVEFLQGFEGWLHDKSRIRH